MPDFDRIVSVKRAAEARLLGLPGVHAVGVGPKLVGGQSTGELAIKVYLVRKKPADALAPSEIIPPEIDGVKTDVIEMEVPKLLLTEQDTSKERPLILGTATMAKNAPERGTLGFLVRTLEAQPRLAAITCQHVVAPPMGGKASDLSAVTPAGTPDPYKITFIGSNTPGTDILVKMTSSAQNKYFTAYWTTTASDTPASKIATRIVAAVNGIAGVGVTAAIGPNPEDVVITTNAGADTIVRSCSVYDPIIPDPKSKLLATIAGNAVTLSGKADGEYAIYTSWSTDGGEASHGGFTPVAKDSALAAIANAMAASINALMIGGITASASGPKVTIAGAKRVLCQITSDIRVGQPTDGFSSNCSLCCTDEIGRVIDARMDLDVALVQLRRGIEYKDQIKGDDDPQVAKPQTVIRGFHVVTAADLAASYPLHKRGITTGYTDGVVDSLAVRGWTENMNPGKWTIFYRFYADAMIVAGAGGPFCAPGDSGSAVFDNNGNVVGMLFAGAADGVVTPIDQITSEFKVSVVTATALDQKHKVSDAEGALAMVQADANLAQDVIEAQAEIAATPGGQELAELARRHAEELQTLVNTNRRVATVWQRNGGPRIVDAVLRFLQQRGAPLPDRLDGLSPAEGLANIQQALMRHGSEALSRDLERHGPRIIALTRLSYAEMLARLKGERATVAVA